MHIAIANDHAAIELKQELTTWLQSQGHTVEDFGCAADEKLDYPIAAQRVTQAVLENNGTLGILLCGTGVGISIAANKVRGIRACCCSEPYSAMLSRQHNNSNILCMGARVVGPELAKMITEAWLNAEFEGGRHATRVNMIMEIESS